MATTTAFVLFVSLMTRAARTSAFVVPTTETTSISGSSHRSYGKLYMSSSTGETEVERLLRMARELRAQAEASEKEVHEQQLDKKADREARLGTLLNQLFYDGTKGKDIGKVETAINKKSLVVDRLRSKKPSIETLERFVDWLDDRSDVALGNDHVEARGDKFVNVRGEKDEEEAERLEMLILSLLEALEVIDGENRKADGHPGGGHVSSDLRQRLKEKRRKRDEQFLKRQASFREAQTIKEGKSKYEFHDEFLDDLE